MYKIRLWPYPVLLIATLRNDEHVTIAEYLISLSLDTYFVYFVQANLAAFFLLTVYILSINNFDLSVWILISWKGYDIGATFDNTFRIPAL